MTLGACAMVLAAHALAALVTFTAVNRALGREPLTLDATQYPTENQKGN